MCETKKALFVDVDGVITSSRDNGFRDFNIHVVHWLRFFCSAGDAKIVISSTWRHSHGKKFWETIFGDLVHTDWRTPSLRSRENPNNIRGDEIKIWLDEHPEVEQYIILDDDKDMREEQMPHLILADPHNGILFDQLMDVRDRLKITSFPREGLYYHPNMYNSTRDNPVYDDGKIKFAE